MTAEQDPAEPTAAASGTAGAPETGETTGTTLEASENAAEPTTPETAPGAFEIFEATEDTAKTAEAPEDKPGFLADLRAHLRRSPAGIAGITICSLFAAAAVVGPWLPFLPDPTQQSLPDKLTPPVGWGGTWAHPLGTDQLGRDIAARLVDGARISLLVSVAAVLIAAVLGTALGLVAGYIGGKVDTLIISAADVQMAFPGVLAGLILVAAFGPSVWLVIVVIAISSWMVFTRVGRSLVFTLKTSLFVEAAELTGAPARRVMWRHLLPNLFSSLITLGVLELAAAILAESAFAFLGFGVQPPRSSWGLMIQQGRNYITNGWWIVTFAGLAISLVVLGVNLLSQWLQSFNDVAEREQIILERPGS